MNSALEQKTFFFFLKCDHKILVKIHGLKEKQPTVHEGVGEDHDRVVEVSVLLPDHAERRPLLLLRRLSRCDARRQVDDHHVCR